MANRVETSIRSGNIVGLRDFLQLNDNNVKDFSGLATTASKCGNLPAVKCLLGHTGDINCTDYGWKEALNETIREGHIDIVSTLIKNGIDVNGDSGTSRTALYEACEFCQTDIVRLLLNFTSEESLSARDVENSNGLTPLHTACWHGNLDIVRMLVDHRCDTNRRERSSSTALHVACYHARHDIATLLIDGGCDVGAKDWRGRTPLHLASYWRDPRIPGKAGEVRVPMDITELLNATSRRKGGRVLELLLSGIASVIPQELYFVWTIRKCTESHQFRYNKLEDIPLLLAVVMGELNIVYLLLEFENKVDYTDDHNKTALSYACQSRHLDSLTIVRYLIKKGAAVNHLDRELNTPLHEAVHFRRVEIVKELVMVGGDFNVKNREGLSARDMVLQRMESTNEATARMYRNMLEVMDNLEVFEDRLQPTPAVNSPPTTPAIGYHQPTRRQVADPRQHREYRPHGSETDFLLPTSATESFCQRLLRILCLCNRG